MKLLGRTINQSDFGSTSYPGYTIASQLYYIPQARVELASSGLQPPVITVILLGVKLSRKLIFLKLEIINTVKLVIEF